jgi:hypothetical protein
MAVLAGWIDRPVHTIRDIFIFGISHIRFSLFICIGINLIIERLRRRELHSLPLRLLLTSLGIWFVAFLVIIESITGLSILLATAAFFLVRAWFRQGDPIVRAGITLVLVLLPLGAFRMLHAAWKETTVRHPYPIRQWDKTFYGNFYTFDLNASDYENGYPVNAYICESELREHWNRRSPYAYDSSDQRGQSLSATLIRFLSSKGWRKDGNAVDALSDQEVVSIGKGIANVNDQDRSSLSGRVRQIVWEFERYRHGGNPSGHSVTQRLEFWKAAAGIIRKHPVIGTGTGDLKEAYRQEYERMGTQLRPEFRLRAHNQYLAVTAALGCTGLLLFLICWTTPLLAGLRRRDLLLQAAWLIASLSMLTEDTLETQAGATFAALFVSLFLFARPASDGKRPTNRS